MNVETANRLVKLRKQSGLSQEDLAEKIGVSRQAVSKWERAESSPDTDNLIALAKIYNLTLDDMLNYDAAESESDGERSYDPNEVNNKAQESSRFKVLKRVPVPIIAAMIYLLLGFVWNLWHPGWLVFMLIPIWYAIFH